MMVCNSVLNGMLQKSQMVRFVRGIQICLMVCEGNSTLEIRQRNEEAAEVCLSGKLYSVTCNPWDLFDLICGVD